MDYLLGNLSVWYIDEPKKLTKGCISLRTAAPHGNRPAKALLPWEGIMRIKNDLVKAWEELIYLFEAYWGEILIGFLAVAALAYFLAKTLSHS